MEDELAAGGPVRRMYGSRPAWPVGWCWQLDYIGLPPEKQVWYTVFSPSIIQSFMTENLEYSQEELYQSVREMAETEGVASQESWNDMVEVVLNQKMDWAEVDMNDDLIQLREDLRARYRDFQKKEDREAE